MALPKASPAWQIFVAVVLILCCAGWLFWRPECRMLLALGLAVSTLGILLYVGIYTKERDINTEVLALFILVFAMLFTLFSIDLAGILNVWILVMVLFVIFLAVLAVFITGRPMGLFIDSRDKMSLATLQTILWTVILLSAFFTVAAAFIQAGKPENAFDIALGQELWALMGISITTLAGTPLIKGLKSQNPVDPKALRRYALRNQGRIVEKARQMGFFQNLTGADKMSVEQLYKAISADPASLDKVLDELHDGPLAIGPCTKDKDQKPVSVLDLFRGDEIVDCHRVDLGKVQMFFFTVIGALAYMLVLADWIATLNPVTIIALADTAAASTAVVNATAEAAATTAAVSFPAISGGFIAILGISHAGFLGNTAVPKTPEGKPPT